MSFILTLITGFITNLSDTFNNIIRIQEKKVNLGKLAIMKSSYSLSFLITFLLGNATAMSAVIFKDALGTFGLVFPVSSCIVLYGICLISIKNMIFYSKETEFYKRELEESISSEN